MPAHDETRDPSGEGPEYDGMDALMAALLDEPLPEGARRDPAFLAARDAAVADLVVLREQLTVIGDTLAGARDGAPAGRDEAARPGKRPEPDAGPGGRAPGGTAPGHAATGPAPPRGPSSRRRSRHRPMKVALGGLVAAAAAGLVLGMGWLVTQGGGASDSGDSAVAQSDAKEADGVAFGSPRYLACARLVAEGTVLAVDPVPGAGAERVTLKASRYYKGAGEVTFLRDLVDAPPLHEGDHVMVGMPPDGVHPDMVVVGEADIAPERARITASLPESRTLTCG
ncbi:hypothetical protein ACH4VX_20670 [Streptomyces sp. NPDC020731]|uniref:hypothetical protein n=1 Tax=Streptomyces sp. NPDC020731 TaxID=3365085 RepID=UPI0037AAFB6B